MTSSESGSSSPQTPTYIVTDPVAAWLAELAVADMGNAYISALMLEGPPGTGKTMLAKTLAAKLKATRIFFPLFRGAGKAELLYEKTLTGDGSVLIPGVLPQAAKRSHDGPVVLILDELDKADPALDGFLLSFLQDAVLNLPMLGGEMTANTRNLLVVLSKNDERPASDPLLRRCRCVTIGWPSRDLELSFFQTQAATVPTPVAVVLVDYAQALRRIALLRKMPSTPEVLRLGRDLARIMAEENDVVTIGRYAINGLLARQEDRALFPDNPSYVGALLRDAFHSARSA